MTEGLKRYYGLGHLHFITCSCRKRLPNLGRPSFRTAFLRCLKQARSDFGFRLFGYVVMPEHFHLLLSEPACGNPSRVMQILKQSVGREILDRLRAAPAGSDARKLLDRLIASAPDRKPHFWQPRFYDFNVWSEKKVWEKLEYMHLNPVKRGLVKKPGDWPWSSYRAYLSGGSAMVLVDRWPPAVG